MTVKNILHWVLAATLICGASVFTACTKGNEDGPGDARKKALLIILDGWGIGDKGQDDVIAQTATPYIDRLMASYPHSQLQASGEYVGLPDGQMGNSETGHLNIGAGRVVYQDLVKINRACADNSILENPGSFIYVTENVKATVQDGVLADVAPSILHIMGLEQPEEMTGRSLLSKK